MKEKLPLSVAIITKNEAKNIFDCLQSVAFAKQIVIVDSGSDDETIKIAKAFGCNIYTNPWNGFGAQKQVAIDYCEEEWILLLDADERVSPEMAEQIKDIVSGTGNADGYSFPRKNFFCGRWIKHAGWWPDRVVRLFKRGYGQMSNATVHEAIVVRGVVENLACPIEHYTESSLSGIIQKIDRYSSLSANEAYMQGKRSSIICAVLRAVIAFFHNYILRAGLLDGTPGLIIATTDAINKFFKYAKLNQLNKEKHC